MSPCVEFEEYICAELDGEITPDEQAALQAHLKTCKACRNFRHAMLGIQSVTEAAVADAPADFTEKVMARVRETGTVKPGKKKNNIIRLWPRYAAVAAMLALVLLGGVSLRGAGKAAAPQAAFAMAEEREMVQAGMVKSMAPAMAAGVVPAAEEPAENALMMSAEAASEAVAGAEEMFARLRDEVLQAASDGLVKVPENPEYTLTIPAEYAPGGPECTVFLWTEGSRLYWAKEGEEYGYLSPSGLEDFLEIYGGM